jgi:hypothetical protein
MPVLQNDYHKSEGMAQTGRSTCPASVKPWIHNPLSLKLFVKVLEMGLLGRVVAQNTQGPGSRTPKLDYHTNTMLPIRWQYGAKYILL